MKLESDDEELKLLKYSIAHRRENERKRMELYCERLGMEKER